MVGFAKEKKELEVAYQQQVDDMSFYSYRCCMKKHDIIDDIPSIPSNKEDEAILREGAKLGDDSIVGNRIWMSSKIVTFVFLYFCCLGLLL